MVERIRQRLRCHFCGREGYQQFRRVPLGGTDEKVWMCKGHKACASRVRTTARSKATRDADGGS